MEYSSSSSVSDECLEIDRKNLKKIRLFGVDITTTDDQILEEKSRDHNLIVEEVVIAVAPTVPLLDIVPVPAIPPPLFQYPNINNIVPPPPLFHPNIVRGLRNQEQPEYLFKKKLEKSDVERYQNRLLIPKSEWGKLIGALTDEERVKVFSKSKDDFVRVVMTDNRHGVEYTMHLKKWPTSKCLALKHQWNKLFPNNGLKKGDSVQGWGYRRDQQFCLALVHH